MNSPGIDFPVLDSIPEPWRGRAFLLLILLPYATRAYHALSAGGGLKGMWDSVWFGTNTPKKAEPPRPGSGAGALLPVLLAAALLVPAAGCTTPQNSAGRSLATVTQTVDGAMQGWASWVALGQATAGDEAKVKAVYAKYQLAEQAAERAYLVYTKTGSADPWTAAAASLRASQTDLLNLVKSLCPPQ